MPPDPLDEEDEGEDENESDTASEDEASSQDSVLSARDEDEDDPGSIVRAAKEQAPVPRFTSGHDFPSSRSPKQKHWLGGYR
ncbi:hypothetical protein PG987_011736 [Apiospora arundinis]